MMVVLACALVCMSVLFLICVLLLREEIGDVDRQVNFSISDIRQEIQEIRQAARGDIEHTDSCATIMRRRSSRKPVDKNRVDASYEFTPMAGLFHRSYYARRRAFGNYLKMQPDLRSR